MTTRIIDNSNDLVAAVIDNGIVTIGAQVYLSAEDMSPMYRELIVVTSVAVAIISQIKIYPQYQIIDAYADIYDYTDTDTRGRSCCETRCEPSYEPCSDETDETII